MSLKRKRDNVHTAVGSLLSTGEFSEFVITCADKTWNVHKAIVCTQSDVFAAASKFGKEAEEARIDLKDDDSETIGYLLNYMYQGDYGVTGDNDRWLQIAWHNTERPISVAKYLKYGWDHWLFKMTRRSPPEELGRFLNFWELSDFGGKGTRVLMTIPTPTVSSKKLNTVFEELNTPIHDLSKKECQPNSGLNTLMRHAKVYTAADKYLMEGLKMIASRKFQSAIRHYNLFASDEFYETIKEILEIVPDGDPSIRDMIVERVRNEKAIYDIQTHPALRDALENIPKLASWVMCKEDQEELPPIAQLFNPRFYRQ